MVENQEFNSSVKIGAHHFAELFAENGYEVLWLSPAYSVMHYLSDKRLTKQRQKLHKLKKIELKKNIYGYAPFTLIPFTNIPGLNSKFMAKRYLHTSIPNLKYSLNKIGFDETDILWISNIKSYYIKDFIKYKKLIYRLSDEKRGFKKFFATLSNIEDDMIRESDKVFATARILEERVKKIRNDVVYLPNGVRYKDFQKENYLEPEDFVKYKEFKKCIYVGAIAEWIDKSLIEYILKNNPDIHFFFIGPIHWNGLEELKRFQNLHLLGKKQYEDIPNYMHFADVAIIPFEINILTDAINPVKLYEYLASGLPTVTTAFKEIRYIDGPFYIAENNEQFDKMLKDAVSIKKDETKFKNFAKENDWENIFYKMMKYIDGE